MRIIKLNVIDTQILRQPFFPKIFDQICRDRKRKGKLHFFKLVSFYKCNVINLKNI